MMRRVELKRSSKSRGTGVTLELTREQRLDERAQRALQGGLSQPLARVGMVVCTAAVSAVRKEQPLRSESYRRVVAAMPCAWCSITGYSQHAHENEGKGARLKVDDRRGMPLCCDRPGVEGCHTAFDQYRLVPGGRQAHIELGRAMAQRTRQQIKDAGQWPAKVPQWQEGGSDAI